MADSHQEGGAREYLVFALGPETYGIDLLKVQEIRGYDAVTRIAGTPEFIKGVINLRGAIVPVVDLRIRFSTGAIDYGAQTVVIVLNVSQRTVGVVVDGVSDVIALGPDEIHPKPDMGAVDTSFMTGLGPYEEGMVILLDIERLMCSPDMALIDDSLAQAG
ncbi:CheW protein [Laribacter hongkongensis HLHK9]|uniref:Chemotaxis protein CheW n=1 Tax=Laribacter hongkongensis (strain HLHK9) TaxID=557598 RepID=C1DCD9_LARHH|nr:chemotaxis protein CheW [Laribacter hongkongensis]ACO73556.1 CheW protein [Laribacter hongkongensis HLHK9]